MECDLASTEYKRTEVYAYNKYKRNEVRLVLLISEYKGNDLLAYTKHTRKD